MPRYCVDPVCKCKVEEEKAAQGSEYKGEKVYFCSVECKEEFDSNPADYFAATLRTGA